MTIAMIIGAVNVNDKRGHLNFEPTIPPTRAQVPVRQHIAIMITAEKMAVLLMFRLRCIWPAFVHCILRAV